MDYFEAFKQLSAALEPWVIGGLGIYIAANQYQSSKRQTEIAGNRLKFDLFQKRFAVYDAVRTLFNSINENGSATYPELNKYLLSIREARWLLSDALYEYLTKEIIFRANQLRVVETTIGRVQGTGKDDVLSHSLDKQEELFDWFYKQMDELDSKFEPFLRLKH